MDTDRQSPLMPACQSPILLAQRCGGFLRWLKKSLMAHLGAQEETL